MPDRLQPVQFDVRRVLLVGALSALGYLLVYLAQQALFLNGLPQAGDGLQAFVLGVSLRGTPPDGGQLPWQLGAYYGGTLALFACYGWLLQTCRREVLGVVARRLLLALPVAFQLALLFGRPTLSRDVYTYVAQGYLVAGLHGNPGAARRHGINLRRYDLEPVAVRPTGSGRLAGGIVAEWDRRDICAGEELGSA